MAGSRFPQKYNQSTLLLHKLLLISEQAFLHRFQLNGINSVEYASVNGYCIGKPKQEEYYAIILCVINHKRAAVGPAHKRNRLVGVVNLATTLRSDLTCSYYMNEQSITSGCYNNNTALLAGTV